MIIFVINRSFAQPILRSSISYRYNLPSMQKSKMKHSLASHNKRAQKAKNQKYPNSKIDKLDNDHIFYLAATAHASFRHLQFFAVARQSKARSFAATQQKSVFIIYIMLMFTLVHFVSCSIAISIIILLKAPERL